MLRRTFFKLLAALPFVGKAPQEWSTADRAGMIDRRGYISPRQSTLWIHEVHPSSKTFTVAQLNDLLKNCTLGPKHARNT